MGLSDRRPLRYDRTGEERDLNGDRDRRGERERSGERDRSGDLERGGGEGRRTLIGGASRPLLVRLLNKHVVVVNKRPSVADPDPGFLPISVNFSDFLTIETGLRRMY